MDIHKNARLTLRSREQLARFVLSGQTFSAAARRFLVTPKTAAKWVRRFRSMGAEGLGDCSSRPFCSPHATPAELVNRVIELRRQHTPGYQIARATALSPAPALPLPSRAQRLHPARRTSVVLRSPTAQSAVAAEFLAAEAEAASAAAATWVAAEEEATAKQQGTPRGNLQGAPSKRGAPSKLCLGGVVAVAFVF